MKVLDRTDSGGVLLKLDAADMPALMALGEIVAQLTAPESAGVPLATADSDAAAAAQRAARFMPRQKRTQKKAPGKTMACSECGKQFKPDGSAKTCSKACSNARKQQLKNAWARKRTASKQQRATQPETRNPADPFLDPEERMKVRARLIAQKVAQVGNRLDG